MNKIEYEGISTCARNEVSQDADDADQKSKIVSGSSETYNLLWEAYFQFSFSPNFYSGSYFTNVSTFTP